MSQTARNFFSQQQQTDIRKAIMQAETDTSGEVRVHIELNCEGDPIARAWQVFETLNMHKTKLRNGVLFYLAVENRKFAIIGDEGINKYVRDEFWEHLKNAVLVYFSEKKFTEGLTLAITKVGAHLKQYFPHKKAEDINELSDEISFDNSYDSLLSKIKEETSHEK